MEQLAAFGFGLTGLGYLLAVVRCRRRGRSWPAWRVIWWCLGAVACAVAVAGPIAERADVSFPAHMVVHLLLGMAGPLLLVRAAPITLALRVLPVAWARRLTRALSSRPVRVLSHPGIAALGNVGALVLLYTTGLFAQMGRHEGLHLLVHAHFFGFGYIFAASIVGVDPNPHRSSFGVRSVVLVLFAAVHSIVSKHIYAVPPARLDPAQAQLGAQLLYYGSDVIDLVLMALLWHRWYVTAAPATEGRPASRRRRQVGRAAPSTTAVGEAAS